jgi:hypothetical protein
MGQGWPKTYPCLLEERLAGGFACRVTTLAKVLHVNKSGSSEHDSLVQEKTDLAISSVATADDAQKAAEVHEGHVRVDELHVCLQQGILERECGDRQGPLDVEILDVLGSNLGRQGAEKAGQLGGALWFVERAKKLG